MIQGSGHRVNIELYFTEIDILGLSKATAYKASGFNQVPSEFIDIRFTTPMLMIKGPYKVNGQISFLPLNGNGASQLVLGMIFLANKRMISVNAMPQFTNKFIRTNLENLFVK